MLYHNLTAHFFSKSSSSSSANASISFFTVLSNCWETVGLLKRLKPVLAFMRVLTDGDLIALWVYAMLGVVGRVDMVPRLVVGLFIPVPPLGVCNSPIFLGVGVSLDLGVYTYLDLGVWASLITFDGVLTTDFYAELPNLFTDVFVVEFLDALNVELLGVPKDVFGRTTAAPFLIPKPLVPTPGFALTAGPESTYSLRPFIV